MDLTAWSGPQGVFSTGDAAHIFGSGPVPWEIHIFLAEMALFLCKPAVGKNRGESLGGLQVAAR
jgi:hypothetical protein